MVSTEAKYPTVGTTATVFCHYRVREEVKTELLDLLARHWPTLRELELVTDTPARVYLGEDGGGPLVIEMFEWVSEEASATAHTHPRVSEIWEQMGRLLEARDGQPKWEFPHLRQIAIR
jgi:hypothetical protein